MEQQRIRDSNPDSLHCLDLEVNPKACDGCKFNPLQGNRGRLQETVNRHWGTIQRAEELLRQHRINPDSLDMDSTETILLQSALELWDFKSQERLAMLIAKQVSRLFFSKDSTGGNDGG